VNLGSNNKLGEQGGKALAGSLAGLSALTSLDVRRASPPPRLSSLPPPLHPVLA